jgi:catechol-2,3-dioxygenase
MSQRLQVISIGANNVVEMVNFYAGKLGWAYAGGDSSIAFFKMNGFLVSIVQKQLLANFIGISPGKREAGSFTLGYNVNSKEEVILHYQLLKEKNVRIVKEPDPGSCFFYFADIEDNILEVSCNPYIIMDEKGNVMSYEGLE